MFFAKSSHVNTSRIPVLPVVSQHCYIAYYFFEAEGSTAHPVSSCKASISMPTKLRTEVFIACSEHLNINNINWHAVLLAVVFHASCVHCNAMLKTGLKNGGRLRRDFLPYRCSSSSRGRDGRRGQSRGGSSSAEQLSATELPSPIGAENAQGRSL
jgi:hypothetical protein